MISKYFISQTVTLNISKIIRENKKSAYYPCILLDSLILLTVYGTF